MKRKKKIKSTCNPNHEHMHAQMLSYLYERIYAGEKASSSINYSAGICFVVCVFLLFLTDFSSLFILSRTLNVHLQPDYNATAKQAITLKLQLVSGVAPLQMSEQKN